MKQRKHFGQMHDRLMAYIYTDGLLEGGRHFYAKAEIRPERCIFSQLGRASGETLVLFTHARSDITPAVTLEYNGAYYIPTAPAPDKNKLYHTVKCGRARHVLCTVDTVQTKLDRMRRITKEKTGVMQYDGFVTELYNGRTEETESHGVQTERLALLLPKAAELSVGQLLTVDGQNFVVLSCYRTGLYRNEYEIAWKGDV